MSCEPTETNGTRKQSLNRENLSKSRGPVLRREERFLKERNEMWAVGLERSSRWTIAIARLFANRCDPLLGVRSAMNGQDLISL